MNTLEEAQVLLDTKKRTGLKYMLAETSYYNAYGILARELFQQGAFGELFYSEVEYSHPIDRKGLEFYRNTWRHGNAPMSYPTHGTSYLVGTTGERIVRVSGLGVCCSAELDEKELREYYGQGANRYNNPFNAEVALGKTDKGHMCRFKVIWTGQSGGERGDLFGTKMSFYTPNASSGQPFKMTGPSAPNFADPPDYAIRLPEPLRVSSGHGGAHTHLTHEFIAAIVEDREPAIDIYTGLAMTVPGIVAHRSALRGGEELKVPVFDRGR